MANAFELGRGTVVRLTGADRCRILNNLTTQDLRKLSHGQAAETFVTDPKGRTFGHGIAFGINDAIFLLTVPDQATKLVPHLDRYIIREDAQVTDASQEFSFWLFSSPQITAQGLVIDIELVPPQGVVASHLFASGESILLRPNWIGANSVLALLPNNSQTDQSVGERLGELLIPSDMQSRSGWELERIRHRWPWYGLDMDDRNLPQELDRNQQAISFNKGCYLGQETIARLDALGQVQKKLVLLEIDSTDPIASSTPLFADEKEVGAICSWAADTEKGLSFALAYVKRSHFAPGKALRVLESNAIVQ